MGVVVVGAVIVSSRILARTAKSSTHASVLTVAGAGAVLAEVANVNSGTRERAVKSSTRA
jgi:hypothetical protein